MYIPAFAILWYSLIFLTLTRYFCWEWNDPYRINALSAIHSGLFRWSCLAPALELELFDLRKWTKWTLKKWNFQNLQNPVIQGFQGSKGYIFPCFGQARWSSEAPWFRRLQEETEIDSYAWRAARHHLGCTGQGTHGMTLKPILDGMIVGHNGVHQVLAKIEMHGMFWLVKKCKKWSSKRNVWTIAVLCPIEESEIIFLDCFPLAPWDTFVMVFGVVLLLLVGKNHPIPWLCYSSGLALAAWLCEWDLWEDDFQVISLSLKDLKSLVLESAG